MAAATVSPIKTEADFQAALEASQTQPIVIFKHSTRCTVSFHVMREFDAFVRTSPDAGLYQVLVVEDRPTSQAIAAQTGVRHESPQAIVIANGNVTWHASHGGITATALKAALAGLV